MYQDYYKIQDDMEDPLAYLARSDPYSMSFYQEMKETDFQEFINASIREVNCHFKLTHWNILTHKDNLKGKPTVDYVWAMNRKREISNIQVYT